MLRYIRAALLIYKLIDLIVDHQDRIWQVAPRAAMLGTWAFSLWAWLSGESPVVITTIAFTICTLIFILLTYIPWWLEKRAPRPFTIEADFMFIGLRDLEFVVEIFNRSKHDRIELEFRIRLQADGKPERWVMNVHARDMKRNLGPQQSTRGFLSINLTGTGYNQDTHFETQLLVIDRISERWAKLKVPGQFPAGSLRIP